MAVRTDGSREISLEVTQHPSGISKSARAARVAVAIGGTCSIAGAAIGRFSRLCNLPMEKNGKKRRSTKSQIYQTKARQPSELKPFKTDLSRVAFADRTHPTAANQFDCPAVG
jgi:hypothetical protein